MAESDVSPTGGLQGWQREHILSAAAFIRERFGNPPTDLRARVVHDSLLEVVDPARRAVRLQREQSEAARSGVTTAKVERRTGDRRHADRRKHNLGPPTGTPERRKGERRSGTDRRTKR